jgi:hypothetical protein
VALEQSRAAESERESSNLALGNDDRSLAQVGVAAAVLGAAVLGTAAVLAAEEPRHTSRDERRGDAKSLGKSKSRSTSSKQLRQSPPSVENIASSSTHDPVREKGKAAARDMAEVYVSIP